MKKSTIIIILVMLTVLMWQGFPKTYRQAEAGELLKSAGVNELESFGECKPAELTLDERAARVIRLMSISQLAQVHLRLKRRAGRTS